MLCAECSTSSRILSCLVDTSNGENEKQKHQDEDSASLARAQLRRYLQRLAQARGESDGMVVALVAACSLIISTKGTDRNDTLAKLQLSILDTSNNDGDIDDIDADDDIISECWALLFPCTEDDDDGVSNTSTAATASTFLRQGPLPFGRLVQSIRQRCLFWVDATHPVAAYVEKVLPTLPEEDMDVALKNLKPLVDWAFRNDGKVLAKNESQSDGNIPDEKILRYRRVARLAQVMSSQGGGDIMEGGGDKMPSPRDEFDRPHQVIFPEGACLEHSCNPNCAVVCRQGDDDNEFAVQASISPIGVELLALCDIEEGERLTVSRMDGGGGLDLSVDSRASTLREIMGSKFTCQCSRCRYERLDRSSRQQIILSDTRDGKESQGFYWKEIKALGDLAMQQGRHEDAEEFYSLVLKAKPDDGDALHARAASYLERGLYCKSQQLWKEAHNICSIHKEISLAATKQKAYGFSTETKDVHGNEAPTSISTTNYTTLMEGCCFITDRDSPILSPQECKHAIKWAEDASKERPGGWTTSRHYAVPTTDLPVHEIPKLLDFFNDVLANRLRPLMAQQFFQGEVGVEGCGLHVHDAFVVRYDAEGGQRHLPVHTDDSSHSFTIALNDLSDYDGGGTYICSLGKSYRSSVGGVFTFRGDQIEHGGDPVVRGIRYVIVGFCYVDKQTVDDADDSNETNRETKKLKLDEMFRPGRSSTDNGRDNGGGFSFGFSM